MNGPSEHVRLKRLKIRSWRRGTKEMDMILGPWSDEHLAELSDEELTSYEALLEENDQDLYQWISGQMSPPPSHAPMIQRIASEIL